MITISYADRIKDMSPEDKEALSAQRRSLGTAYTAYKG
jgi:hypothetical protein